MLKNSVNKRTSRLGLAILLIVLGCFNIFMFDDYIVSFLGALIFYVLFRPFMQYLCNEKKWRKGLAAAVILLISFVVVVGPIFLVSIMIVPKLSLFFSDT